MKCDFVESDKSLKTCVKCRMRNRKTSQKFKLLNDTIDSNIAEPDQIDDQEEEKKGRICITCHHNNDNDK